MFYLAVCLGRYRLATISATTANTAIVTAKTMLAITGDAKLEMMPTPMTGSALPAGIPVSHFDSHQHIHTLPQLFPVLKALQRRFSIRRVRSTINLLPPGQHLSPIRWLKKRLFCCALRWHYRTASPEGLGEFRDFYAALHVGQLPWFRELELMVHPGTTAPTYIHETDLLRSGWRRLLPPGIAFGNYYSIS